MSVNHEVKGNLARLLATEDLIVEHKRVDTACFNVHTRVLTLPLWEKASSTVYDLLVGHEVGHALFTPDEEWNNNTKIPQQFVNVVEDARIEKLMKRKYLGLNKTFYRGYEELHKSDFFMIGDDDVTTFNLADRTNLYFKIGTFLSLKFEGEEQEIIEQIQNAETFDEVLAAANRLYEYCKQEIEEKDNQKQLENNSNDSSGNNEVEETQQQTSNSPSSNKEDKQSTPQEQLSQEEGKSQKTETQSQSTSESTEKSSKPEVKTMSSFENAIKELVNQNSHEHVYVEIPEIDLDRIIISNKEVHEDCQHHWRNCDSETFESVDLDYKKFKKNAQKEVTYLVKEFECRKAADSYARSSIARTGVLDCTKLHTYKFNEDLFRKVTTCADGKNHGLIFILDWSGSMSRIILDTIKQLYNLIWFCKKVNIPFEVYSFVTGWERNEYNSYGRLIKKAEPLYTKKENVLIIDQDIALLNFFSSKTNSAELEKQMMNIYRIATYYSYNGYDSKFKGVSVNYHVGDTFKMGGTPLNETLIALHKIIPQFKKENKLQKVHTVILTDGDARPLTRQTLISNRLDRDPYYGVSGIYFGRTYLRDKKLGTTYKFSDYSNHGFTDVMLENLRDNFEDVSFIGIRLLPPRDVNHFLRTHIRDIHEYEKYRNAWTKNKTITITSSGYHSYFGISATSLFNDVEFEVAEDATKSQIKNAFSKSLKGKKMNKKILNEFIGLIA